MSVTGDVLPGGATSPNWIIPGGISFLLIGLSGPGSMTVANGGTVSGPIGYVGWGADATVTVSGTDGSGNASTWTNAGNLFIGFLGNGTLIVSDGGKVSNTAGMLGSLGEGLATITGTGSTWTNADGLVVGDSARGTLTVSDGGRVDAPAVDLASSSTSNGTINIGAAPGDAAAGAGTLNAAAIRFGDGAGTLNFNHTGLINFAVDLSSTGSGSHALDHYAGTTMLTGDGSGFTGTTTVLGGTLVVDGTLGGVVRARSGGTVSGAGTIAGHADLTGGGVLAGAQGQTLRIGGDLLMDGASVMTVALGAPSATGLFEVGGNLTLAGTLNVTDQGGFGAGIYRIVDYHGALTGSGLVIGDTPSGVSASDLSVQTAVAGQVNLIATTGLTLGFWDGGNAALHDNGAVDGGAGVWRADGRNWTLSDGSLNGPFKPIPTYAVFQNIGGVVTVDGAAGDIAVTGMQFAADGYRVEGDPVALQGAGGTTTVRVGDGTAAGAGMTATIASALTGSSTLVKSDAGTLILSGANSYTGGTRIVAGTLIGDAGSIRGDIGNAATVVFDQNTNASFNGGIAGLGGVGGAMVKRGAGTLALAGPSSLNWSVEAGALTTAADRFGGDAAIGSGARLSFDQAGNATYAGILSGSGAIDLTGSGAVTLTGNSAAFNGTTTVGSGNTLIVGTAAGGVLGGSITVSAGGQLGGTGTLGSAGSTVTVAAGAVHAPGNSIGVQTIAGNYANHGTLRIEATPAGADRIVVAGSVDITGAALDLALSPANAAIWNVFNGPFTIIDKQSAGGVTGTFASTTRNLLFLDAILDYAGGDGNDVTLTLERNDLTFAGIGKTRNQIATGAAIDTLGNANPIWRSVALSNNPNVVRASFDALSGEVHASAKTALIEDSRFIRNAVNDRIRAAFGAVGASHDPVVTYGDGGPRASAATAKRLAVWGMVSVRGARATATAMPPGSAARTAASSSAPTLRSSMTGASARWPATAAPASTSTIASHRVRATITMSASMAPPPGARSPSAPALPTPGTISTPAARSPFPASATALEAATTPPPRRSSASSATASGVAASPWSRLPTSLMSTCIPTASSRTAASRL